MCRNRSDPDSIMQCFMSSDSAYFICTRGLYDNAYSYLLIIFLGIPFTILYNYLSSILRSVGDSRTPFIFLALSAVLNIFLDLFCIVVLKLGCAGAAIATISAQAISGILCLIFIIRKMKLLWLKKKTGQ